MMTLTQNHDKDITRTIAGIIAAVGNILTRIIRKPVATIKETTKPRLQAKMAAVKKSRIDFEISIVESPVIPESRLP